MAGAFQTNTFQNDAFQVYAGGAQSYSYTATGGMTFSGTSTYVRGVSQGTDGGLSFAGAAGVTTGAGIQSLTVVASGGVAFSGSPSEIRSAARLATGGLMFGGTASITLDPDPNPVTQRHFKRGRRPRFRIY